MEIERVANKENDVGRVNKKLMMVIFKYTVSGAFSTFVQFAFLSVMVELFYLNPTFSSGIGFIVACVVNYLMLYYWTFSSNGKHHVVVMRYTLVTLVTLVFNLMIFWFLTEKLQLWYLFSQVFATGTVALLNFGINYRYTFPNAP